jgi:protein-L-isoaspartate O-methyltransferase
MKMEKIQRHNMVRNQIRTIGIEDERILSAMAEIEREKFVLDKFKPIAYSDSELPISDTRLIARPEMTAKFLEAAEITSEDMVLEIGCGTGYSSHIISRLAQSIVAIDNCKKIISIAKKLGKNLNNLSFSYCNFEKLEIDDTITVVIVNGATFNKRADFSLIQDRSDLFNFKSAILIDNLVSKMPSNCRLLTVEGYYKYHTMNIVRYRKDYREVLDQIYYPEMFLEGMPGFAGS